MPPFTVHHPHSRPIPVDSSITMIKKIATYFMDVATCRAVGFGNNEYIDLKEADTATFLQAQSDTVSNITTVDDYSTAVYVQYNQEGCYNRSSM
jgi:hypothetical protein